ncbi:phosphatidic acid phosphatase type 2/haloperoxidase [Podospora aff. communis PSN243]|uniref:Phosphatidic acid phosphatase type 2/haloperoxidase n=1 Tax=Podospora aff. communis PSN243 TaxID=3040156 RepID=A0AAV9GTP5_9PEZI|nr:phosphatidic acid phosphatase type 2/haloperoxidase [Podospora aff. communis PSN243]
MRASVLLSALAAAAANAAYPGDIVNYWVEQTSLLVNGTVIGGLQSPPSAWYVAVVTGAIYEAAVKSKKESLAYQQLAVSHAAHNAIVWVFHGTRNYNGADASLRAVLPAIGLAANTTEGKSAIETGRKAAKKVALARADDGINNYVAYTHGPKELGVYQATPGGNPFPDVPQAQFIRPFGGFGDITRFRSPPPPPITSKDYEEAVIYVKEYGGLNSTARTAYDTDTAYFWRESSITGWNRFASVIIGNKFATKVVESAKFWAQLNFALANAGIASWDVKYTYDAWRPITALHRTDIWLPSGLNVSDPSWTPLLRPTPSHQDYVSTHSTFGGAAAAVLRVWNGGDEIDATWSSNVTIDNRGVITRRFTSLKFAAEENSRSRVFGGVSSCFLHCRVLHRGKKGHNAN